MVPLCGNLAHLLMIVELHPRKTRHAFIYPPTLNDVSPNMKQLTTKKKELQILVQLLRSEIPLWQTFLESACYWVTAQVLN